MCSNPTRSALEDLRLILYSVWNLLGFTMVGLDGYEMVGATWYISAMLLAMPPLYALILRNREGHSFFMEIGCLLLSLFLYGYIYQRTGAIYEVRTYDFTSLSRGLLTFFECSGYIAVFTIFGRKWEGYKASPLDFIAVLLFAVCTIITCSEQSYTVLDPRSVCGRITGFLGRLSVAVYFCHGKLQAVVIRMFPEKTSFHDRFILYIAFTLFFSLLCLAVINNYKNWYKKNQEKIARPFLKS